MDERKVKFKPESKSKLHNMYFSSNSEVSRGSDTPLYVRKEQKINDRLQDKINILKNQAQMQDQNRPPLQQTNSKEQLNRSK